MSGHGLGMAGSDSDSSGSGLEMVSGGLRMIVEDDSEEGDDNDNVASAVPSDLSGSAAAAQWDDEMEEAGGLDPLEVEEGRR